MPCTVLSHLTFHSRSIRLTIALLDVIQLSLVHEAWRISQGVNKFREGEASGQQKKMQGERRCLPVFPSSVRCFDISFSSLIEWLAVAIGEPSILTLSLGVTQVLFIG